MLLSLLLLLFAVYFSVKWRAEQRRQVVRMRDAPSFVDLFGAGSRLSSFMRLQLAVP